MRIALLRSTAVAATAGVFHAGWNGQPWMVRPHPGVFDRRELVARQLAAQEIRIAIEGGAAAVAGDGMVDLQVVLSAFVICNRSDDGEIASNAAESIVALWHNNNFAANFAPTPAIPSLGVQPFVVTRVENMYSGEMHKQGAALWSVSAASVLRLGDDHISGAAYNLQQLVIEEAIPSLQTTTIE